MEIKDVLIKLRKDKALTQTEVAAVLQIGASAVSKYEIGRSLPEYDTLLKLADFYDVSLDYLFGRTAIQTPVNKLEKNLETQQGSIPIDFIFQLDDEDRELVFLLLKSISKKAEYNKRKT